MSKKVKRLFEQFMPENYTLSLEIDEENMAFSGTVEISGKKTGRPSKRITFHQKDLQITDAKVLHKGKETKVIVVDRINLHKSYDEVRLHSPEIIYPGNYEVTLKFEGKITDQMTGLYPCYFEKNGEKQKLFATQFESHHAREVFPCIDEPEAKATFDLTLTTKADIEVLSNTGIKNQKTESKKLITSFEQTPIMSSYLLAFVIGDMHCVEGKSKNGILVRSWATTVQDKKTLQYANQEAVKVLDFFEEYFGTPFPLKKLDQVALPDFESGAMENWGLITYREVALLTDPDNRSLPTEQYVSMVIAHEISHQWFGNLVTMKWWDDLWLNESFASLMEHVALDKIHPDWQQWESYASSDIIACSNRDIYSDVQPVGVKVSHPDEISTLFDPAIVYAKGGRLLKMLRDYIGEPAFREALKNYFKKHAYSNTYRDDLWQTMSDASGKDIVSLMSPWLEQSGMPVIKLEQVKDGLVLSQSRFVLDNQNDTSLWPVPLLSPDIDQDLLTKKDLIIESKKLPLLNPNGSGHYITHYANDRDLKKVIDHLKSNPSLSEGRINMLNDMMLLARRGDDSLVDALVLVNELSDEPRDAVWSLMSRVIGLAYNLGEDNEPVEDRLKKFRFNLAHSKYEKLGWDDVASDDPNTVLLRATIISMMLGAEDKKTLEKARSVYKSAKNIESIPSDRRGLVFSAMVRIFDDQKAIDELIEKYKTTNDPDLQSVISSSLSSTKSEKLAKRLIDEALGEKGFVRAQDIFRWFAYLMRNKYTRGLAWEWLTNNWERLYQQFGGGKSMDHFVIYASAPMQTELWYKKFDQFFTPKESDVSLRRNIKVAKAEIQARIDWRNRELKPLESYFKSLR